MIFINKLYADSSQIRIFLFSSLYFLLLFSLYIFFLPFLQEEIQTVAPKVIVTLGNVPLKAVTGEKKAVIGDYHGKPQPLADGRTLFALYHPAAVIYNRALQEVYDADLIKLRVFLELEKLV